MPVHHFVALQDLSVMVFVTECLVRVICGQNRKKVVSRHWQWLVACYALRHF